MKLFKTSVRGRELIINVFEEGATFNEVPVFDHAVNPVSGESSMRITQDQLTARLCTVREVVARSLRELERSGAILVERRTIKITYQHALDEWMECPQA